MSDARLPRAAVPACAARRVLFAALCAPLLLSGCYVVPVAPAQPVYRPVYPKPYYYPRPYYRGYGPYGLGPSGSEAAAPPAFARRAGTEARGSGAAGDVEAPFVATAVAFEETGRALR